MENMTYSEKMESDPPPAYPPPNQLGYPPQQIPGYPPQQIPGYPQYANMQQAQPVVIVQQQQQIKPADNMVLSILTCICCNTCCLGLVALIFAYQSQQSANRNAMEQAKSQGITARNMSIASIILTIIVIIIVVVVCVVYYVKVYNYIVGVYEDNDDWKWNN
jgi:heme/copper-type cytochrome/quinol oxidase subunit 2